MNKLLNKLYAMKTDGSVKRCLALLNVGEFEKAARILASRCCPSDVKDSYIFSITADCFADLARFYLEIAIRSGAANEEKHALACLMRALSVKRPPIERFQIQPDQSEEARVVSCIKAISTKSFEDAMLEIGSIAMAAVGKESIKRISTVQYSSQKAWIIAISYSLQNMGVVGALAVDAITWSEKS